MKKRNLPEGDYLHKITLDSFFTAQKLKSFAEQNSGTKIIYCCLQNNNWKNVTDTRISFRLEGMISDFGFHQIFPDH